MPIERTHAVIKRVFNSQWILVTTVKRANAKKGVFISDINNICKEFCHEELEKEFAPGTGLRTSEIIAGDNLTID